ncbi:MAG: LLM class flavin-dependent oxidoreductase, partial [Acidimicrobiia bacterium]|nr:LLM class flavin-dependent oxidoreductase [Acidimicrobiia bacterium]
ADLDPTFSVAPEVVERVRADVAMGRPERAAAFIDDETLDRFAFSGTPDQVADQVGALLQAGAARVELGTPHGVTPERGIELIGERVLPVVSGI